MIRQVTFENWKSFRQATLHIEPFTIVIGTSASGKTNAMEGLALLGRMSRGRNVREAFAGETTQQDIRGGTERATFKKNDHFTLRAVVQSKEQTNTYHYHLTIEPATYLVAAERLVSITSEQDAPAEEEVLIDMNVDKEALQPTEQTSIKGIAGRIDRMVELSGLYTSLGRMEDRLPPDVQEVCRSLQRICVLDPIPGMMRQPIPIAEALCSDGSNTAAVIASFPAEQQQYLEGVLSAYAARLPEGNLRRVFARKVGKGQQQHAMLFAKEQWQLHEPPLLIDARTMSDGTLRFLAILTSLLTRPKGSLVVIENIDHGLHATRTCLLVQLMREIAQHRGLSVVITTHNPDLLEELEPEMVARTQVIHRDLATGESSITTLEDVADLPRLLATLSPEREATRSAILRGMSHSKRGEGTES